MSIEASLSRTEPESDALIAALTPSDVVRLDAESFLPRAGLRHVRDDNVALLRGDGKVNRPQLVTRLLAAALLANERAGTLTLVPERTSSLFGLLKGRTMFVERAHERAVWPDLSLEQTIAHSVAEQDERVRLADFIAGLFEKQEHPAQAIVDAVDQSLVERGVLASMPKKGVVFTTDVRVLPADVAAIDTSERVADVAAMFTRTEVDRPEVWAELVEHVEAALTALTEYHHYDQDHDGDYYDDLDWD